MAENKMARMRELVDLLNRARRAYEQEDQEIMSNYEYDRLYDELEGLEKELGTRLNWKGWRKNWAPGWRQARR